MSRFETETLTQEDNLKGLALMNPQWVELAMAHTPHRRVILDMDSSESPVHGQQEGAAYNGHFECVCYHPLFLFNQFGDCEGATLRPGNVHSADGWQELRSGGTTRRRAMERNMELVLRILRGVNTSKGDLGAGFTYVVAPEHERIINPNPPKDTDGRREESGRGGVRELQGK